MARSVAIYNFDANPDVDRPKGFISFAEREIRAAQFGYRQLSDFAVQEPIPAPDKRSGRSYADFRSAWGFRESGGDNRAGRQLDGASRDTPDRFHRERLHFFATGLRDVSLPLSRIASVLEKGG